MAVYSHSRLSTFENCPGWLRPQRFDIFLPDQKVAIEYHGEQHYRPISFFGGEKGFQEVQRRDSKKKDLADAHGVKVIEWPYTREISKREVKKFIDDISFV